MAGTIKHQWNGTILTITSDSGTSSADLKGAKGDDGARGVAGAAGGTCYNVYQAATNLLDNSYFLNPINQRGQTTYTGNAYTIDRWKTYSGAAEVNITANGVYMPSSALMELLDINPDKTYTAAVKTADGNIAITSGTFTAGFGNATLGIRCGIAYNYCRFLIDSVLMAKTVEWAALYEGTYTADTLPAYQYKGYAAELMECMRYYQVFAKKRWVARTETNGGLNISERFIIPMRAAPTITKIYVAWGKMDEGEKPQEQTQNITISSVENNRFIGYFVPGIASINLMVELSFTASADL